MQIARKIQTFIFGLAFGWGFMPCLAEDVFLPFLDSFCAALEVERTAHSDHLLLDGGAMIEGEFKAYGLSLDGRDLSVEDIAAIQSGQGTHAVRVFLRDGSVLRGLLTWKVAHLQSETLGSIALKSDHTGQMVMRLANHDGKLTEKPVAWMADRLLGQVLPLMKLPEQPLRCRWLGGLLCLREGTRVRVLPEAGKSWIKTLSLGEQDIDLADLRRLITPLAMTSAEEDAEPATSFLDLVGGQRFVRPHYGRVAHLDD